MTESKKEQINSQIEINLLDPETIKETSIVYSEAFKNAGLGEDWTEESAENFINYWYKQQPDLFFIAKNDGKVVGGVVGGIKPWWNGNHLADFELFVHPQFQEKGIAKALMRQLVETAIGQYQIAEVEGVADGGADFPLKWYERIGIPTTGLVHIGGDAKKVLQKLTE